MGSILLNLKKLYYANLFAEYKQIFCKRKLQPNGKFGLQPTIIK